MKRQTDLSEKIRPPHYPFKIDQAAAKRGASLFAANCNSCHGGPESDKRLYSVAEVGTDPHRAEMFTQKLADGFNTFLAELESEGYEAPKEVGCSQHGKILGCDFEWRVGALALPAQWFRPHDVGIAHAT